jgi:5-formyltetrahydrofolate cyclo-ligase
MRLTSFSDYTLRTLMYLGLHPNELCTIDEIAAAYDISANHLMKVVQQAAQAGEVLTVRGQHGGMRLARPPEAINIGTVVRRTEPDLHIAPCFGADHLLHPASLRAARRAGRRAGGLHDGARRRDSRGPHPTEAQAVGVAAAATGRAGGAPIGQQALNWESVRVWRKEQRAILIDRRLAVAREDRARWSERITAGILHQLDTDPSVRLGFYWPFKGEYDPRAIARRLHAQGVSLALPVVMQKAAPLVFRAWNPGARLVPGVWNIPVPADGETVLPDTLLVPLIGYDQQAFRLGYGGGFYDRTLAAMPQRPVTLGIGFALAALPSIHPQPHDIPMDVIITEQQSGSLSARRPVPPPPTP